MLKLNNRDTRNTIFAELLALSILSLKILASVRQVSIF
jgi:hypothetical protein